MLPYFVTVAVMWIPWVLLIDLDTPGAPIDAGWAGAAARIAARRAPRAGAR